MGYKNHNAANLRYGTLAGKIALALNQCPAIKLHVLVTDNRQGQWHLKLRPHVAKALEDLGWV